MPARPVIFHRVAELYGIEFELLNHPHRLKKALEQLAEDLKLHVVKKFTHKFEPHGISVVWVIAESHLAVHTWPELGYMHVDVVSCSRRYDLSTLPDALQELFKPTRIIHHEIRQIT